MAPRLSIEERFWAKVHKTDDCWLWTAYCLRDYGYGQFWDGSKRVLAHRFCYELLVGPIPAGLQLDHRVTCPKNCVNPDHLRPATNKQNQENTAGARVDNKSSGIRGVHWDKRKKRWHVSVGHNRKLHFGGTYADLRKAEEAAISLRNRLFTHNDVDRCQ